MIKKSNPRYIYVPGLGQEFPVQDSAKFNENVELWLKSPQGKQYASSVAFRDGKVLFTKIKAKANCFDRNPASQKEP